MTRANPSQAYPSVDELVPHDAPMILVDELVEWSPTEALVRATVRSGGAFVVDGRVPGTVLLEYMAQAIAVADGMSARITGKTDVGLLLGTRELSLACDHVAVGDVLDVRVRQEFADASVARYACEVARAGDRLADAVVNVMLAPPDEVLRR